MDELAQRMDALVDEADFAGVIHVQHGDHVVLARAFGLAHRALAIPASLDTQFAVASGAKGLTAITVMSLIRDSVITLDTTARSILGADLPLIDDAVTVEHLLSHRSGIGDYLDEDVETERDAYLMPVPVQFLADTEQYLAVLDGHPQKFAPGERFSYCNGGYVVLALLAERAATTPFRDLVEQRVCGPAGMIDTAFLRSDALPGRAALGYLQMDGETRTNVFHLPVRGSGDGGVYTTAADVAALWRALFDGRLLPIDDVDDMVRPRSTSKSGHRYGLGFWLCPEAEGDAQVMLQGYDSGVSFCTWHHRDDALTYTVLANTSEGAWPLMRELRAALAQGIGKKSTSSSET